MLRGLLGTDQHHPRVDVSIPPRKCSGDYWNSQPRLPAFISFNSPEKMLRGLRDDRAITPITQSFNSPEKMLRGLLKNAPSVLCIRFQFPRENAQGTTYCQELSEDFIEFQFPRENAQGTTIFTFHPGEPIKVSIPPRKCSGDYRTSGRFLGRSMFQFPRGYTPLLREARYSVHL